MATITARQLAELLIGIARAQQAIVEAAESQRAGFKGHLGSALQTAARNRNPGHTITLMDLPARILLAHQGRTGPAVEQIAQELESFFDTQT